MHSRLISMNKQDIFLPTDPRYCSEQILLPQGEERRMDRYGLNRPQRSRVSSMAWADSTRSHISYKKELDTAGRAESCRRPRVARSQCPRNKCRPSRSRHPGMGSGSRAREHRCCMNYCSVPKDFHWDWSARRHYWPLSRKMPTTGRWLMSYRSHYGCAGACSSQPEPATRLWFWFPW